MAGCLRIAFRGNILPNSKRTHRTLRLSVEALETRRVLSASPGTATLTNGELVICGTAADDSIGIVNSPNGYVVVANFLAENQVFTAADVTSITITGEDGNDRLIALDMTVPVTLEGGAGTDILFGGSAADTLRGGDGDDYLYGRGGDDSLFGDAGADILLGHAGADNLNGGDGDDFIFGNEGDDTIDGGAGADAVFGHAGNDSVTGGDGGDLLVGGDGDDTMFGNAGIDRIFGVDGSDQLDGGADNDSVYGGAGADVVIGQAGVDQLFGGDGADALSGGSEDDMLVGGADDDVLIGGAGGDSLNGQGNDDVIIAGTSASGSNASSLLNVAMAWADRSSYDVGVTAVQTQLVPDTSDDSAIDSIFGADGRDAFFTSGTDDTIAGIETTETVIGRELLAVDDSYSIDAGATLTVNVANGLLENDVNPIGGALTASTVPVTAPVFGTITINEDGTFTYNHTGSVGDVDTFDYEIVNADQSRSQATVTITAQAPAGNNTFALSEHAANNALVGTVQPTLALGDDVVYEFSAGSSQASALSLAVDDHLEGDTNAPVVLIEYFSLQCPTCARYHDLLKDLKSEFSEELLVVNRHLPLPGIFANSTEAALFAEAAAQQGMFDEMIDLMFERQADWSPLADPTATFEQYASDLGLNISEVQAAVSNADAAARVARDSIAGSQDLSLTGTPSFFINDDPLPLGDVPDEAAFRARIQQAIDENVSAISLDRKTGELRVADSSLLDFDTNPTISFSVVASNATDSETISVAVNLTNVADQSVIPELPAGAMPTTTSTGLQVYDLELGDGSNPVASDRVRVDYVGYLPNGTIFDSNENITFPLPNLVAGFSEGVQGMQEGGTRRIFIPPDLGYGSGGNPGAGISGTDTIVFDVVLRSIA